ncbi:MAG TPA: hypothetical protein VGR28_04290 [Candidatus Thermoplasmatota archaeon]|jgi:hypothetical protein|nr:hypothetical protein [Candidatus Thermoplasmatota archaeon]
MADLGRAAALLRDADVVPILVAPDADSVLAGGLLGLALRRAGVPWHARFVPALTRESLLHLPDEAPGQPVVLIGIGGREAPLLDGAGLERVVLVDPRRPRLTLAKECVTAGGDGDVPCTAATLAWDLARQLDARAPALPALAGLDATGPLAGGEGLRAQLAEAAEQQGCKAGWVPALPSGPLVERLADSVQPYLPGLGGRARAAKRLLEGLGLEAGVPAETLGEADAGKLASALTLHVLASGAPAAACWPLLEPDLRGPWPGGSARELAALTGAACGAERPGLALTLALGDARGEPQARPLAEARAQRLLQALLKLEGDRAAPLPWTAEPDLAADLSLAGSLALRAGAPVGVLAGPGALHVAAPGASPRLLGQAAWEVAQGLGGTGSSLGARAVLEVPAGRAGEAWELLRARLEAAA